ncbi:MAG: 1-phosphofructokinase family hexose kinase [Ignavibacteria bacterium]|nr:1-phosphofructokinase family hexose kinase [Ignavibacteria bacterium]
MILTITLNPLLEKVLYFEKVERGKVNRARNYKINAGGKGINVSRQLNKFKIENLATGFLGGENGKRLKSILYKEEIKNSFQTISNETREGFVVAEDSKFLESYFFPEPIVKSNEVDSFIDKTKKAILNSEMVIFSGSSPRFENPDDELRIFSELISFAEENDKYVLVDVYGSHLSEVLKLKPDIVHVNLDEFQSSMKLYLNTEEEVIKTIDEIYKLGIKIFIITNGEKKFYAINHGFKYEVIPPEVETINPTGSGDAFMAGFIYALHHNLPFEEILIWATASGAANASMMDVCSAEIELIQSLKEKVIVKKLN